MGNGNHTAEGFDQGRPNRAGSSPSHDSGFSQRQDSPDRFQVAFQKMQEKKKKLQERNQGEWVCCSAGFVQVTPFRRLLLGYEQDVFFCESFVSNLPDLEGLLL